MGSSEESILKQKFRQKKNNEEIIVGFQKLRKEYRFLSHKLIELDLDLQEHRFVLKALKDLDDDSKRCFRLIGEILCERTVKDVIVTLKGNEENIGKLIESYSQKLKAKEDEIEKYKEAYNITFQQAAEETIQRDDPKKPTRPSTSLAA